MFGTALHSPAHHGNSSLCDLESRPDSFSPFANAPHSSPAPMRVLIPCCACPQKYLSLQSALYSRKGPPVSLSMHLRRLPRNCRITKV